MVEGEGTGNIASNRGPHNERTAHYTNETPNILIEVQCNSNKTQHFIYKGPCIMNRI